MIHVTKSITLDFVKLHQKTRCKKSYNQDGFCPHGIYYQYYSSTYPSWSNLFKRLLSLVFLRNFKKIQRRLFFGLPPGGVSQNCSFLFTNYILFKIDLAVIKENFLSSKLAVFTGNWNNVFYVSFSTLYLTLLKYIFQTKNRPSTNSVSDSSFQHCFCKLFAQKV